MSDVLSLLNVTSSKVLLSYTTLKDKCKELKKVRDQDPKNKRKRAHKAKAKLKHEILLKRKVDIKLGTYKSGVACKTGDDTSKGNGTEVQKIKKRKNNTQCTCGKGRPRMSSRYTE